MRSVNALHVLAAAGVLALAATAVADEFHVESKVFRANDPAPIVETTTLFHGGYVYDFLGGKQALDPETTVFDPARGRLIVMDTQRRLWTQVSLGDVKAFSEKVKLEAAGHTDGLLNFLANPQFEETTEDDVLNLNSPWMTYKLKTIRAKSDEAASQYAEFSHWHAQLNVMINPGTLPPFGRLAVNDLLEQRKLLPLDVQMTILPKEVGGRRIALRAEHRFQWTLLESDRERISEAGNQLATFRQVTLEDYNRRIETAAKPTAPQQKK